MTHSWRNLWQHKASDLIVSKRILSAAHLVADSLSHPYSPTMTTWPPKVYSTQTRVNSGNKEFFILSNGLESWMTNLIITAEVRPWKWHFLGKQRNKPFDLLKVRFNVSRKPVGSHEGELLCLPMTAPQSRRIVLFFSLMYVHRRGITFPQVYNGESQIKEESGCKTSIFHSFRYLVAKQINWKNCLQIQEVQNISTQYKISLIMKLIM